MGNLCMHNEFTAVIEQAEEGGYFAWCPEVPGANGQGETEQETLANLRDAIRLVLDHRREQGLRSIPSDARTQMVAVE